MKQLGGMDASFLYMETPQTPMHVAGLSIVELPDGFEGSFYDVYKAHIAGRLHLFPVLQKKLVQVPWDIDHPLWVDDDEMEIDYHIRHLGLPKPGTLQQLDELVGRLHSNFLDRSRPLWEFYVIDGLADGHVAIYTKMHHAAVDGGAGMVLTQMMYDTTPVPRKVDPPTPKEKAVAPDGIKLLGAAYKNMLSQHVSALQKIPDILKAIASIATPTISSGARVQIKGLQNLTAPKTMLNASITSQRSFTARSMSLAAAKAIAKQSDTKLNDVVMAVCAGALRRYLDERGALPTEPLVAMVPVSTRSGDEADKWTNRVSALLAALPTNLDDPVERVMAMHETMNTAKQRFDLMPAHLILELNQMTMPALATRAIRVAAATRILDRVNPPMNLVISNVPGPRQPLYAAGARMTHYYPVSTITDGQGLNITVQSYTDSLDFGLVSCRELVPDVWDLLHFCLDEVQLLKKN